MKRLARADTPTEELLPVAERHVYERLLVQERQMADMRAQMARLSEATRWAAASARGMKLDTVADMLEDLLR